MENSYKYFKRDISWLSFNYRVLLEAEDETLPIYERIKFLSIYSSNLEEFYEIRVAEHRAVIMRKNFSEESADEAEETLAAITREVNRQLTEANKIKNEYIGLSFCANSELLQRLQKLFTTLDHRIAAHQYGGLRDIIGSTALDAERDSMYAAFDAAFLKLFPDFIEKYNMLFEEKYRTVPRKNSLTSEMRIFALIRLGISDSERIANFLNYSVHTVNTYKTRVKNRSLLDNSKFEPAIMAI